MVIIFLILMAIFCIFLGVGCYIAGHREGFIDGRLDEKWRRRDERKTSNLERP